MAPKRTPTAQEPRVGSTAGSRVAIIQTVQTPLGFFVLVVLVVEGIIGTIAGLSNTSQQSTLVFIMAAIVVLLVATVTALAVYRPEALGGQRAPPSLASSNALLSERSVIEWRKFRRNAQDKDAMAQFLADMYSVNASVIDVITSGYALTDNDNDTRRRMNAILDRLDSCLNLGTSIIRLQTASDRPLSKEYINRVCKR